jgi:hypothetical protein
LSKKKVDITAEIAKLNPDEATVQALNYADCKSLEKHEAYWLVDECKNDVYFKLFLRDGGYYLGYCTPWQTPREAVLKLKSFVGDCVNLDSVDGETTQAGMKRAGLTKYSVCGREFVFKDECIVGV